MNIPNHFNQISKCDYLALILGFQGIIKAWAAAIKRESKSCVFSYGSFQLTLRNGPLLEAIHTRKIDQAIRINRHPAGGYQRFNGFSGCIGHDLKIARRFTLVILQNTFQVGCHESSCQHPGGPLRRFLPKGDEPELFGANHIFSAN